MKPNGDILEFVVTLTLHVVGNLLDMMGKPMYLDRPTL
jgi:hypothetical protein